MQVLVHFYDEWSDFRLAQYNALLELFGVSAEYYLHPQITTASSQQDLFRVSTLPSAEVAVQVCKRAVLVRGIYELWGQGGTFDELVEGVRGAPVEISAPWCTPEKSWCVDISSFGKSISQSQKEEMRKRFKFLNFTGTVALHDADLNLGVLLDFSGQRRAGDNEQVEENETGIALGVPCYCGRLLARGGMREELRKYDLKKRLYLGPTSLDHSLALIMANLAGAKSGCMALDPFVGTASILVALSHFGAQCFGTDIDVRVLKGAMYAGGSRHPGEKDEASTTFVPGVGHLPPSPPPSSEGAGGGAKRDIFETFRSYGLAAPELIRMDLHLLDRHLQSGVEAVFDVIVTDPPYGIRAGGRKSGKTNGCSYTVPEKDRPDHIPSTQNYPVEEVMLDLLHASARLLAVGGSLCYLIPTSYEFDVDDLPKHPCLELTRLCHQGLSTRHGRHAVVMRKVREYSVHLRQEFDVYRQRVLTKDQDSPDGFSMLLGKLEKALAPGGFEDQEVVKVASKGALRRKDSAKSRKTSDWTGPFNGRPRPHRPDEKEEKK